MPTSLARTERNRLLALAELKRRGIPIPPQVLDELRQQYGIAPQRAGLVWQPDPRNVPQCDAYNSPAFELLYGGAAGGGKTSLLLGLARTKHRRALLLRRTFPDLERTLIKDSYEFYGSRTDYNAGRHSWDIIDRGVRRSIEFGHMERMGTGPGNPGDEDNYAGAPYDLIGWDQLEQFGQYVYEFLFSRARTSVQGQRVRIVNTANPVGKYLPWIIARWAAWLQPGINNPAQPGELRWYKRDANGKEVETTEDDPDALSRTFIPARLSDNPYYGDDYRRNLMALPEPLRSALLNGDFMAAHVDAANQVIPTAWVQAAMNRWKPDGRPIVKDENGKYYPMKLTAVGVDVARGGGDDTTFAPRYGTWYAPLKSYPGQLTPNGQSVIVYLTPVLAEGGVANIDVIGVGSSVYDLGQKANLPVRSINFANKSLRTNKTGVLRFTNRRAEGYWLFREALDPSVPAEQALALPPDPELLADLTAPTYEMQTNGIRIEEKDAIRERLHRSPDKGDAVVMAHMATGVFLG